MQETNEDRRERYRLMRQNIMDEHYAVRAKQLTSDQLSKRLYLELNKPEPNLYRIKDYLDQGANIHYIPNTDSDEMLHSFVRRKLHRKNPDPVHVNIMKLLLQYGADPSGIAYDEFSPESSFIGRITLYDVLQPDIQDIIYEYHINRYVSIRGLVLEELGTLMLNYPPGINVRSLIQLLIENHVSEQIPEDEIMTGSVENAIHSIIMEGIRREMNDKYWTQYPKIRYMILNSITERDTLDFMHEHTECNNDESVMGNTWNEVEDDDIIKIRIGNHTHCFEKDGIFGTFRMPNGAMSDWMQNPLTETMDAEGYGGIPGYLRVYMLPNRMWIDEESYELLMSHQYNYFIGFPIASNFRIGNRMGTFGVSELHGQLPGETIYQLSPAELPKDNLRLSRRSSSPF